jgi:FkbM family methyltransferase
MNRLLNRIKFTANIVRTGADFASKLVFLREAARAQVNSYLRRAPQPFHVRVGTRHGSAAIRCRGTLDELHALIEIFVDKEYEVACPAPVKVILDLGANSGLASTWFALRFPGAKIHAYEPDPVVFKYLEDNLRQFSNARAVNAAISGVEGVLDFYRSDRSFSSSLHPLVGASVIRVRSMTLDQAIASAGGDVDIVKMDIEGAEFSAIEMSTSVACVKAIVGEVHPAKGQRLVEDLVASLARTHSVRANGQKDKKCLFWATRAQPCLPGLELSPAGAPSVP